MILTVVFAIGGSDSLAAQDRYALTAPNGISFSEVRGYETWQVIAPSRRTDNNELRIILGNTVMVNAYKTRHSRKRQALSRRVHHRKDRLVRKTEPCLPSGLRTGCSQEGRVHREGHEAISRHQRLGICAVRLRCKDRDVHALWKGRRLCAGMLSVSHHREGEGLHIHRVSPEIEPSGLRRSARLTWMAILIVVDE